VWHAAFFFFFFFFFIGVVVQLEVALLSGCGSVQARLSCSSLLNKCEEDSSCLCLPSFLLQPSVCTNRLESVQLHTPVTESPNRPW